MGGKIKKKEDDRGCLGDGGKFSTQPLGVAAEVEVEANGGQRRQESRERMIDIDSVRRSIFGLGESKLDIKTFF